MIPWIYRIGLYFCIVFGIYEIVRISLLMGRVPWMQGIFVAIMWLVAYPIILRIICEVLLILSDINDSLLDIKAQLNHQGDRDNQTDSGSVS